MKHNRIWYDLMISLIYPSVLGVLIYFFFEAIIRISVLPILNYIDILIDPSAQLQNQNGLQFFESFGFTSIVGFIIFLGITLLTATHHSIDYLFSKYTESQYDKTNFFLDILISLFLAGAYITLSQSASSDFQHIRLSFIFFWLVFAITYLIFYIWDSRSVKKCADIDPDQANFHRGMKHDLDIFGLIFFPIWAIIPLFITKAGWISQLYVISSIFFLAIINLIFGKKIRQLEMISKGEYINLKTSKKTFSNSIPNTSISQMTLSDVVECSRLFVEAYQKVYAEPWTLESGQIRINEIFKQSSGYCRILKNDQTIIGFIIARPFGWYDGNRLWIEEFVIDEQFRGKGFGNKLLRSIYEKAKSENMTGFSLLSKKGSLAFKFYQKKGFDSAEWLHLEAEIENFKLD
jgi:aminoglycoside 6'-N-acetyltransferase I